MDHFPLLSSGAIAQYPSATSSVYRTRVMEFVGGNRQRYREIQGNVKRWIVHFDRLTPDELGRIEEFFREHLGIGRSFAFTDPWSSEEYDECCFEADDLQIDFHSITKCRAVLVIRTLQAL